MIVTLTVVPSIATSNLSVAACPLIVSYALFTNASTSTLISSRFANTISNESLFAVAYPSSNLL